MNSSAYSEIDSLMKKFDDWELQHCTFSVIGTSDEMLPIRSIPRRKNYWIELEELEILEDQNQN